MIEMLVGDERCNVQNINYQQITTVIMLGENWLGYQQEEINDGGEIENVEITN